MKELIEYWALSMNFKFRYSELKIVEDFNQNFISIIKFFYIVQSDPIREKYLYKAPYL